MVEFNREITEDDLAIADNLKAAWGNAQSSTGMAQHQAAAKLGISQSAFSQFLNGKVAPSTDFILQFCNLLGISLKQVSPKLYAAARPVKLGSDEDIGSLRHLSLLMASQAHEIDQLLVDSNDFAPRYYAGDVLRVVHEGDGPQENVDYVLVHPKTVEVVRISRVNEDSITFIAFDIQSEGSQEMSMDHWSMYTPLRILGRH